ncbi:MAG: type VI secretion system protein ImpH [Bermanella sp.]|jgi:type VI secretion system protein ImpH
MAAKPSESLRQLEQDILENGTEYNFFQAYRLLESVNETYPVSARRPARKIEVRPELSLGYTEQDISKINALDKNRGYEIISQLPGLYGVASPLPDFYNEELLDNEWDEHEAPREFLDIIHKQLFPKLYQAWRLYKLNLNTVERSNDSYWNLLFSLLGDPNIENNGLKDLKLRYFSLFANKERSKEGIRILISDFLDLDNIEIQEFNRQEVNISESLRCRLGEKNHQIGVAHIGSKILDQSLRVTAVANNISELQYKTLNEDTVKLDTLKQLLTEYLKKPLQLDLKLNVDVTESSICLGKSWNQLGITSNIGTPSDSKKSTNPVARPITIRLLD